MGPGVNMEVMRSVKKVAMAAGAVGWLRVAVSRVGGGILKVRDGAWEVCFTVSRLRGSCQ